MVAGGLLDHLACAALVWQSIPRQILRVKHRGQRLCIWLEQWMPTQAYVSAFHIKRVDADNAKVGARSPFRDLSHTKVWQSTEYVRCWSLYPADMAGKAFVPFFSHACAGCFNLG